MKTLWNSESYAKHKKEILSKLTKFNATATPEQIDDMMKEAHKDELVYTCEAFDERIAGMYMYVTLYKNEIELQRFDLFDEDYMTYAILCDIWQSDGMMKIIVTNSGQLVISCPSGSDYKLCGQVKEPLGIPMERAFHQQVS